MLVTYDECVVNIPRSIHVYDVFLREDSLTRYSLVFEATPNELYSLGRIAGMKINGKIMIAVFLPLGSLLENEGQVMCVNLVSKVTTVVECPDWVGWTLLIRCCTHR